LKNIYKGIFLALLLIGLIAFYIQLNKIDDNIQKETIYKTNHNVEKISEGQEIKSYHYSLDWDKYFLEYKYIRDDPNIGPSAYVETYYDNKEISTVMIDYTWDDYKLRDNRTLKTVWINNNEAIFIDWSNQVYLYNTTLDSKSLINFPKNVFGSTSFDINKESDKIVFSTHGSSRTVYIYNLENKSLEKIYKTEKGSTQPGSWLLKNAWGTDNNIYFDSITENHEQIIKKYNLSNEEITTFAEDSYILNISPDKRYLTYIDKLKNLTVVYDLKKNIQFEIPYSEELLWLPTNNQFVSVEDNKLLTINTLNKNVIVTEKYDIGYLIKEDELIYNLQYVNSNIRFDIVDFEIVEQSFGEVLNKINNVTTYELEIGK